MVEDRYERKGIIVYRAPGFLSNRLDWVFPSPPPQASVSPPQDPSGGTHSLVVEGEGGGPIQTT